MTVRRIAVEAAALVVLALACAWASNALAGPARRLSWRLQEVRTLPALPPAAAPLPPAPPAPPPPVAAKKAAPAPAAVPAPAAPKPDPAAELLARFPALVDAPQADIGSEDAKWLHARGALFLDARRSAVFAEGHIAGARPMPVWEDGIAAKVEQLAMFARDLKAPVVVYCSGGDCHDSHLLAEKLWLAGFRNLRIYTGGYPDWESRGWPTAKGEAP